MRVRRNGLRALLFAACCLGLVGGPLAAQPAPRGDVPAPTDEGRRLDKTSQMTRTELLERLRSLQQPSQSPEELGRLKELMKGLPTFEQQQNLAKQYEQAYGKEAIENLAKQVGVPNGNFDLTQLKDLPNMPKGLPDFLKQSRPPQSPTPAPQQMGTPSPQAATPFGPPPQGATNRPGSPASKRELPNGAFKPGVDPSQQRPDLQKLIGFWEKNVGPLENTPALKEALFDIVNAKDIPGGGVGGVSGADGQNAGFLSFLENQGADAGDLGKLDWFDKTFEGSSWKMPELGLKDWGPKWSAPSTPNWSTPSAPSAPPSSFGGSFGGASVGGASLTPILLLAVIVAAALIVWKFWPGLPSGSREKMDLRRGPWPVDPRSVSDRDSLVRAFEYLSVLLCGDAAKVWHHRTIAAALRARVVGADAVADELAGLYELARYTHPSEPLSPAALASARRCLCHLAGVAPA